MSHSVFDYPYHSRDGETSGLPGQPQEPERPKTKPDKYCYNRPTNETGSAGSPHSVQISGIPPPSPQYGLIPGSEGGG